MYIAIDIGGTKTLVAVLDESGQIIEKIKFATPHDYSAFLKDLKNTIDNLSNSDFVSGAIGTRGVIDKSTGTLVIDNVLGWENVTLVKDVGQITNCKITIENDSKAAGLSEAIYAGNNYHKVLYITISTGIGSAFIVNDKLDTNTETSEIGKWLFPYEGRIQRWESFASGSAIVERHNQRASDITDPAIWAEVCDRIALGLINACAAYTPDVVILGGGVGSHYDAFKDYLNTSIDALRPVATELVTVPPIMGAKRPEEAVIYGCYELARQNNA